MRHSTRKPEPIPNTPRAIAASQSKYPLYQSGALCPDRGTRYLESECLEYYNHWQNIWDRPLLPCEVAYCGKGLIYAFQQFFASVGRALGGRGGDWVLGCHSMKFRHFPDISFFLKSLGNSWGNSYMPCL